MLESIEFSKFFSHKARVSDKSDLRKDLKPNKLKQTTQILVKLSFRELHDSKLSVLCTFDNMTISLSQRRV